jgi:hypothetical protein
LDGGLVPEDPLRPGAGAIVHAPGAHVDAEGRSRQRGRRHWPRAVPRAWSWRRSDCPLLLAAPASARSLQPEDVESGLQADQLLGSRSIRHFNGLTRAVDPVVPAAAGAARTDPDVRARITSVIALLTNSDWSSTIKVEGYKAKEGEDMNPLVNAVGPGFDTLARRSSPGATSTPRTWPERRGSRSSTRRWRPTSSGPPT